MLLLYVAMKYDYGKPELGLSFEHNNFYDTLRHMGYDILYFDYMALLKRYGVSGMNKRLWEVVKVDRPKVMFTVLFQDELDQRVIQRISEDTDTITINWFCDDHWRFDTYSRYWTPRFNWVVTTANCALPKYKALGYSNVIKSQWACNHYMYRKLDLPLKYDVSFVGQPHGNRRAVIRFLQDSGIDVHTWGAGWESGRLSQEAMIQVFNQTRINLNFSNASTVPGSLDARWTRRARQWLSWSVSVVPYGASLKRHGKRWLSALHDLSRRTSPVSAPPKVSFGPEQIKGRNFEVPGCGGFILTGRAENLADYYCEGKEIVCFNDARDLLTKIRYYLSHEEERIAIALSGYERTLREHTYAHRFAEIFTRIGLAPICSLDNIISGRIQQGKTQEIW